MKIGKYKSLTRKFRSIVSLFLLCFASLSTCAFARPIDVKSPWYEYNTTTHQLIYGVSDAFNSNISVSAWVTLPDEPPKGVLLYWHGSFLAGTPFEDNKVTPPRNEDLITWVKENLSKGYIIVEPHMIGCGVSYGLYKQRWMILDSVKYEGNAILENVWRLAKEKYHLKETDRLDLYQFGSSQGGTNAFAYHMFFQNNTSLQKRYLLKHTYASAGFYSKDVLVQSLLTPFSQYKKDPYITTSFQANDDSSIALSKQMQYIVLAHLIYTYQNFNPSLNLSYANDYNLMSSSLKGDNFMFLSNLYFIHFKSKILVLDPTTLLHNMTSKDDFRHPAYLSVYSWKELNANSSSRAALVEFIEANSIREVFADDFKNNQYPITLICSDNDLNVLSQHSKKILEIIDFPHLTRNTCHKPLGSSLEIYTKIRNNPFHFHFKSHLDARNLLKRELLANDL